MVSQKQTAAARTNIKKAASAARKKTTIAHLPKSTRTAFGKKGAAAAKKSRFEDPVNSNRIYFPCINPALTYCFCWFTARIASDNSCARIRLDYVSLYSPVQCRSRHFSNSVFREQDDFTFWRHNQDLTSRFKTSHLRGMLTSNSTTSGCKSFDFSQWPQVRPQLHK